jgi:acetaldehyde dehydrogenase (acetylating)
MDRIQVGILGTGNIGTDLLVKILRSQVLRVAMFAGVDPESEGIRRARDLGVPTSTEGVDAIVRDPEIQIVFDATSAHTHVRHARALAKAGKIAIDLTPAAIGPYVVPNVNLDEHLEQPNVNMVSCGGQAVIPIIAAVNRAARANYAEAVITISSKSAGPGTRQNIDEFTKTTSRGMEVLGGAERGKAIIILNPAEPPILMRATIYALVDHPDDARIDEAVRKAVHNVSQYVPGYRLKHPPHIDGNKVTTMLEVEGAGDHLPTYAGNLDIMTSAAVAVGERIAQRLPQSRTANIHV